MPKVTTSLNAFTAGELSPRAKGRFDLAKYASGATKLENFLINQLGGVSYRPGTRFLAETKDSSKASRLIPFQYQADSDYVIEMGDLYMKMYENDGDAVVDTVVDAWTKLLLHNNGIDAYGALGGSVIDSSATPRAITKVGTAEISPSQYKFGNCSLSVDGDSDYVTAPDHADWDFAGNWTVEGFIYITADQRCPIFSHRTDNDNMIYGEVLETTQQIRLIIWNGGALQDDVVSAVGVISLNTLTHVAFLRIGASYYIFVNGVQVATAAVAKTWTGFTGTLQIGHETDHMGTEKFFAGYIDEVRISNLDRSTGAGASFPVPTSAYTSDANTLLLLHCDTIDSSSITTPKIITFNGTAQLDTTAGKMKFGTASLLLDGNSDWISAIDSDDYYMGTGDFTLDVHCMFAGIGAQQNLFGQYEDATNYWFAEITAANKLQIKFVDGGVTKGDYITTAAVPAIAINTYYHFRFVRDAASVYIFVDGTSVGVTETTAISTNDVGNISGKLKVGAYGADGAEGRFFNGWMDEVRISKGYARSTADFVAPTAEYTLDPVVTTELVTTYLESDIFDIQYAQNNDIMYLVHPDYAPRKLSRTSATAFSLSLVSFVRGPFLDDNTTATTITPSSATGATTLTASANIFDPLHVGSLWRINKDATAGAVVKITAYTSPTVVDGTVQAEPDGVAGNIGGVGAYTDWAEGAFSAYRGYPSCVAFHEQRLYYGNTKEEPQKFWGSEIATYDCFTNGYTAAGASTAVVDSDAIAFEVATEQRNAIKWLSSGNKALTIGSQGGTFSATSGETTATIASDNIVVSRDSNYGAAGLMPKRISSFLYYIQRDFIRLRELAYSFQIDNTVANDMTLLAEHILKDGGTVVDIDHQQSPNDRIFCVRNDGEIAVLTRNPEQDVMGWCRLVAGTDSSGEKGEFESVCVIPKQQADDQVWVIVKRSIGGSTKRFIEYFSAEDFDEDWDAIQCDSSLSLDLPNTITGVTIADDLILYTAGTGAPALADGDQIKINGVVGTTEINGTFLVDTLTLGVSFKLKTLAGVAVDFSTYGAWISGGEIRKMVTNISGLTHLEGETVVAQVDGYIPSTETYVVSGGAITLSARAAVVHVGLPYYGTLQLLKLSDGSPTGTGQTKTRRIYKGTLRLYRTQGLSIGRTTSTLDLLNYDDTNLYTGDMDKVFQTTWNNADEIIIYQEKPLPANILAVITRSEVEE